MRKSTLPFLASCPANGQGSGKGRQPEINTQPRPQQEKDAWNRPLECLYKLLPASTPKGWWRGTARPQRRRGHPQSGTNHSGTAKHAQPLLCRLLLLLPNAQPISTRLPLPRHDCKHRHAVERQRACKAEGCEQARCPLPSRPGTLCTRCPRGTAHVAAGPATGMPPGRQAAGVHVSHGPAAAAWGEQRVAGCSSSVADAAKWRIRLRRSRCGCNVGQQERFQGFVSRENRPAGVRGASAAVLARPPPSNCSTGGAHGSAPLRSHVYQVVIYSHGKALLTSRAGHESQDSSPAEPASCERPGPSKEVFEESSPMLATQCFDGRRTTLFLPGSA